MTDPTARRAAIEAALRACDEQYMRRLKYDSMEYWQLMAQAADEAARKFEQPQQKEHEPNGK